MPNYHVLKSSSKGDWVVKRAGSGRISGSFDKKIDAERAAKRYAANAGGGEVRIHNLDGRIMDSDTVAPAKDLCSPRDNKH